MKRTLLCIVARQAAEGGAPETGLVPTAEASDLAQQVLGHLDQSFHMHLLDEGYLQTGLATRFTALLVRLRYGIDRDISLLLDEARSIYPLPFEMAEAAGSLISQQLDVAVPDSEIGALALYLARMLETHQDSVDGLRVLAVGDLGHDGAHLLEMRLRRGLGAHAAQVMVRSAAQLSREDFSDVDLVLASVAPPDDIAVPVIKISPFPTEGELGELRLALTRLPRNTK